MLKRLWQALFAPSSPPGKVGAPQPRRLVDRVCANEHRYAIVLAPLQSLNLPEDERRKRCALDVFVDPNTRKVWEMVIVEDGPSPLYGLENFGEVWPAAAPAGPSGGVA